MSQNNFTLHLIPGKRDHIVSPQVQLSIRLPKARAHTRYGQRHKKIVRASVITQLLQKSDHCTLRSILSQVDSESFFGIRTTLALNVTRAKIIHTSTRASVACSQQLHKLLVLYQGLVSVSIATQL